MADPQLSVLILLYLITADASTTDYNGTQPSINSTNSSGDTGNSATGIAILTYTTVTYVTSDDYIITTQPEQVTVQSQSSSLGNTRETHSQVTDSNKSSIRNRTDFKSSSVTSVITTGSSVSTTVVITEQTSARTSQSPKPRGNTFASNNMTSPGTLIEGKGFFMLSAGVILTLAVVVAAVLYSACRRSGYRKHMSELLNTALTDPPISTGCGSGDQQENGLHLSATSDSLSNIDNEPIYAKPFPKYKRVHYNLEDQV